MRARMRRPSGHAQTDGICRPRVPASVVTSRTCAPAWQSSSCVVRACDGSRTAARACGTWQAVRPCVLRCACQAAPRRSRASAKEAHSAKPHDVQAVQAGARAPCGQDTDGRYPRGRPRMSGRHGYRSRDARGSGAQAMTAARYVHGAHTAARELRPVRLSGRVRHGRDTSTSHERMMRPVDGRVRREQDWR